MLLECDRHTEKWANYKGIAQLILEGESASVNFSEWRNRTLRILEGRTAVTPPVPSESNYSHQWNNHYVILILYISVWT